MSEHHRRERLALYQLQSASIQYSHGELSTEDMLGFAHRYASAVRERRVHAEQTLDAAAMDFERKLWGEL